MLHLSDIYAVAVKKVAEDGYTENGLHAFDEGVADFVIPEVNGCLFHHMLPLVFIALSNYRPKNLDQVLLIVMMNSRGW